MSDLTKLRIWDDPAIGNALSWYLEVAENRRPAKFRIAATVATGLDPTRESEDALWAELDSLMPLFLARWQAIRAGRSCRRQRTDQASSSYAGSSHTACSATAISVLGIVASTA